MKQDGLVLNLRFLGHDLVHMDEHTYSWVDIKRFAFEGPASVHDVLAALIGHEQYGDDYAGGDVGRAKVIHGRYVLSDIRVESFKASSAEEATRVIAEWADRVNGPNGPGVASSEVRARLDAEVFPLLAAGEVLRFEGAAEHEWGWVVGGNGFHEYVVIGTEDGTVSLVVASDD